MKVSPENNNLRDYVESTPSPAILNQITVFIIHPERLFRELLGLFVSSHSEMGFSGSAASAETIVQDPTLPSSHPSVILHRFYLSEGKDPFNSIRQETAQIRNIFPNSKLLMLGPCSELEVLECIRMGSSGYCLTDASLELLFENIQAVVKGEALCSRRVAGMLFSHVATPPPMEFHITPREREILALVEMNLANKEIALRLNISVQTTKNHVHNLLYKLKLASRREAARFARTNGLLRVLST